MNGTVVNYIENRGFGFVHFSDSHDNAFFRRAEYEDTVPPQVGQSVTFTLVMNGSKPQAKSVKPTAAPMVPAVMHYADDPRKAKAGYTPASPRVSSLLAERDSQHDFGIVVETPKDGAQ